MASVLIAGGATLAASRSARRNPGAAAQHLAVYAEAAENAFVVYLAESVVSGFKYVVADFWCLWAFTLAVPCCIVLARKDMKVSMATTNRWQSKPLTGDT